MSAPAPGDAKGESVGNKGMDLDFISEVRRAEWIGWKLLKHGENSNVTRRKL
jgi:hypothetical protein